MISTALRNSPHGNLRRERPNPYSNGINSCISQKRRVNFWSDWEALGPERNNIIEYENGSQQCPTCSFALNLCVNSFVGEVLQFLDVLRE
jgi:hypothetical protein